jgi:hypothetical protein
MSAYTNHEKTTSAKGNSGRKSTLLERDHHILRRIVSTNHTTTAAKVTGELNIHLEDPAPTKTARRELHKSNIHGKAAIVKPLITESNAQMRKRWHHVHKRPGHQTTGNEGDMSVEMSFTLFPTSGRVMFGEHPRKPYNPVSLAPTVKHGGGSVIVWAAIS